jgi:hypothetical protein
MTDWSVIGHRGQRRPGTDGMTFYLVNEQGGVEGQVSARPMRRRRPPGPRELLSIASRQHVGVPGQSRQVTSSHLRRSSPASTNRRARLLCDFERHGNGVAVVRSDSAGRIRFCRKVLVNPATARRQSYSGPLGCPSGAVVERCRVAVSD